MIIEGIEDLGVDGFKKLGRRRRTYKYKQFPIFILILHLH
jgi:hypothetical protein